MKNLKSYVRTILGENPEMNGFNDFEKGLIFLEKSRLDTALPSRKEFMVALDFAKDGIDGLLDSDGPRVVRQVAELSIELLEMQIEILDKCPEETSWTYRKSYEVTKSDEDLCNRMDFLAGKLYQLIPIYSKEMETAYIKDWMNR